MNEGVNEAFFDFLGAFFTGACTWFFGGLDGLLTLLLVLIVIDYLLGVNVAWLNNTISSKIGFRGIVKKCMMLTFVGIAHLLDEIVPGDAGAIRLVVCCFYIANEGKSIIENAHNIGIPVPEALIKHFSGLHKEDSHEENNTPSQ